MWPSVRNFCCISCHFTGNSKFYLKIIIFSIKKALGAYLSRIYSDDVVVLLATLIAILDLLFILCCVPESRKKPQAVIEGINNGFSANPFIILRFLRDEQTILRLSAITFLSYLPEAGQFSCFFVYLRLVNNFYNTKIFFV